MGSSLYNKVKHGVCYAPQQAERTIKRHRYDSIVEGVGLDRLTANFELAQIDDAMRITDQEIIDTAHWLLRHEGLFVGSSSALNVAATCRLAVSLAAKASVIETEGAVGGGSRNASSRPVVVTVICDSGQRHVSRLWNPAFVRDSCYDLHWPGDVAGDGTGGRGADGAEAEGGGGSVQTGCGDQQDLPPWMRKYG